jgi:YHS domain-containing protein
VAYFTANKATKGTKSFAVVAEGVTYYFASAANKTLFLKDFNNKNGHTLQLTYRFVNVSGF